MRRRNCKLRDIPLQGARINCARFSTKINQQQNQQSEVDKHEYFVTGDSHNNIRFYEFMSEDELMTFNSNPNLAQVEVSAVCVSWQQTHIYSGSSRGIINSWDILEGKSDKPSLTLKGHTTAVNCFGLFPDSDDMIASGSDDTTIKIWDTRSRNNVALKDHTEKINYIDVSPDGNLLLSSSEDRSSKLWDIRNPSDPVLSFSYKVHQGPVLRSIFNPEDCMFASCSSDRTAKYFNCDKSKKVNGFQLVSSTELVSKQITAIDFNPEGTYLCTAGDDILKIWDMRKNGLLVESIESAWRGVQDILWCEKGIKGISSSGGSLSIWFCYLGEQISEPRREQQLRLPKIMKNPSVRRESSSANDQRKPRIDNSSSNKDLESNPKIAERNKDLQEVMNNVNLALGNLNNVAEMKNREKERELEEKKAERLREEKLKQEERKQRIRLQKQKEREQKETKERERRQRIQRQKQEQQRQRQQKIQKLERQRRQRQKELQEKLQQTLQQNKLPSQQADSFPDELVDSSVMNISSLLGGNKSQQTQQQIKLINEYMLEKSKYENILSQRMKCIKPILSEWKKGQINNGLYILAQADMIVTCDTVSAILKNSCFKMAITPDVACGLIRKLVEVMNQKHSSFVKTAMQYINEIVLMFKDELIKVKTFNPMAQVDLTREERLAKYDRLTEEFLNVFKQERLKKYSSLEQNCELNQRAFELYKNLEQVLRKILPKKQPEAA